MMIPERDYVLAKDEVRRRRAEADDARRVREARREAESWRVADECADSRASEPQVGPFAWLRRLAGV